MNTQIYRGKDRILQAENKNRLSWSLVIIVLSFFLPIILMMPGFCYMKIFPFGTNSTMAVDLRNQYAGFYEAFRRIFSSPASFNYSWMKSLGGEMLGTFSYYVMGPVNLIMLAFSRSNLPLAIELVQLIKLGLCGSSMAIFLINREKAGGIKVVLFSCLFALSSFVTANLLNHMWLDVIWLLPIVVLFLERMIAGRSPLPYVISLTLMILSCYYMAFMACIFLSLYCIYALVRAPKEAGYTKKDWFKNRMIALGRFIVYSAIAGGISACVLSPVLYSLSMSKRTYAGHLFFNFKKNFAIKDIFSKMVPAAYSYSEVSWGLPNIFSGTVVYILLVFFFMNRSIKIREKIVSFFIITIFVLSMYFKPLNLMWHGLQGPNWYPYRYSWLLSFFIILLAYRASVRLKSVPIVAWFVCLLLYGAMLAYLTMNLGKYHEYLRKWHILAGGTLICLLLALLMAQKKVNFSGRGKYLALISLISLLEISTDAAFHTGVFNYENINAYKLYDKICMEALEDIRPGKDEFWRISKSFKHDNNDPMRFNYPGISHFNSHLDRTNNKLLSALGFASAQSSVAGDNSTKFTDSFLGIRYFLESKDNSLLDETGTCLAENTVIRPDIKDMDKVGETDYVNKYEVSKPLSLGHMVQTGINKFKFGRKNPIDSQDMLANLMDGNLGNINYFSREAIHLKTVNNMTNKAKSTRVEHYNKVDKNKEASLVYDFTTYIGASYYLTVSNTLNSDNSELFLDGKKIKNTRKSFNEFSQVYNVAAADDGNLQHTLEVKLKNKDGFDINNISLFRFNEEAWDQVLNYQMLHGLKVESMGSTYISGTVAVDQDSPYLLLTVPYDDGWRLWVDGQAKNYEKALDSLIMVKLPQGQHRIEMSYQVPYLLPGVITSILSLIVLLVCNMVYIRKSKYKMKIVGRGRLTYQDLYDAGEGRIKNLGEFDEA